MQKAVTSAALAILMAPPAAASAQTSAAAERPTVRVISTTGVLREGRLVELTPSEAVLLQNGLIVRLPLNDVRRIDKATHGVRTGVLAGAIGGLTLGMAVSCASKGADGGCSPEMGAMFTALGAGIGTAAGILYDDARRSSNVLYAAPGLVKTVNLPMVVLSAGSGGVVRRHGTGITAPAFQTSVQIPLWLGTSLETEALHWSWRQTRNVAAHADEAWSAFSVAGNISWRIGSPTTAGTIAVGAGVQRATLRRSLCLRDCDVVPAGTTIRTYLAETTPYARFTGGAERAMTQRLIAFGSIRLALGDSSGLAAIGGVRVPLGRRHLTIF